MIANTVAMLLALAALSGCAAPAPGTMAPQTAAPEVAAPASAEGARVDRTVTLPSGATLKVAADWTVTTSTDGLILEDPEKQLKIELVEVEATAGMSAAISTAWSRRHPGFNRQELHLLLKSPLRRRGCGEAFTDPHRSRSGEQHPNGRRAQIDDCDQSARSGVDSSALISAGPARLLRMRGLRNQRKPPAGCQGTAAAVADE